MARALVLAVAFVFTSCSEDSPSTLDPSGPGARRVEGLWWLMFWISAVVFAVVLVLLAVALLRRRARHSDPRREVRWGEPFIVVSGVIVPSIILAGVYVVSLRDMKALSDEGEKATLTVEVIGHDWWWEAKYPGTAVTANEIHIPVGEPVRLKLTSADVIHSFWAPELHPKLDNIPGKANYMWLQADEPGRYRGQCAEFCGLQHANMAFYVVADPPSEFDEWLANEAAGAVAPTDTTLLEGATVFMELCAGCHAIRGTDADGLAGPDLTHLAARETIAAGTLPNTREALHSWIVDPQRHKPGASMPPNDFTPEEIDALIDYLESLD